MSEHDGVTNLAWERIEKVRDLLREDYRELLWVLRHASAAEDDVLVEFVAPALGPLDDARARLDAYLTWRGNPGSGRGTNTGTVDVPDQHDGGGGSGGGGFAALRTEPAGGTSPTGVRAPDDDPAP